MIERQRVVRVGVQRAYFDGPYEIDCESLCWKCCKEVLLAGTSF